MKKERYVATGELLVDCYWTEEKHLALVDGGGSRFNVICHLASRGKNTCVIAGCGQDIFGKIAIDALENLKVDTTHIMQEGDQTRTYHLIVEGNNHISKKTCPICGKITWYNNSIADIEFCKKYLLPDDILILDGLKQDNLPILLNTSNRKVLDIGRIKRLEELTNEQLYQYLCNKNIHILQLNEVVEKYLLRRLELTNLQELYAKLNPELLIVTRGKKGADFVYNEFIVTKELIHCSKELDDTGAGDAFLSVVIQEYFEHNQQVTTSWIDETFEKANELTSQVVSHLGARGSIYRGYVPDIGYNCLCNQ